MDLKSDLQHLLADFKWNFKGIIDGDGNLYPIPKIPQVIAGIFEGVTQPRIERFVKSRYGCKVIHGGPREYPNLVLKGGKLGDKMIAIDVKTARRRKEKLKGRASLGSCAGYFLYPDEKRRGCRFPYGQFSEHWIALFLYSWHPEADTLHMVSDVEVIIQPKWKIASRRTATGDTAAIGSIKDISRLRAGKGIFHSEREFEDYWRKRGRRYKR